ncbi:MULTISPECIES: indole-3-glycerol phosphate synthase TrpC [Loigolactobacillus]|uniref:Indole-3-glycerol phosphate synthase n=1 Tax=Loigolactobacillus backii TaxID=375175 RepID=A0A192H0N9_9LACO|nr:MULTISPECIES: indole-3-glycerol phosphate synthase TrpC [Loigolactobacillus]ANK58811.1 indole-3-glycerol phosphate synthase [Loigolactobacillus backii]ANK61526.1 indole-3-glycerol phosphate synthase [Loigolactobacillus backii]ANK63801.1 indole-3-glycerol phosphate synthase [Loigolactobacillus backii]ANK66249.1 indole-3-glycerol phosphate synthase [Loigolactobacillus backii]ANK69276.1 indole-3-glycerol phosphate synthase [Loigolactobacillus backii]
MILDDLVKVTKVRVTRDKQHLPLAKLQQQVAKIPKTTNFPFEKMLHQPGLHFICEIKKASPSKGEIAADFPYLQIAQDYVAAGVEAISVLTEPTYFKGQLKYLKEVAAQVPVPVLRKDFTIDSYMIYQAKANGAQVILLICAILSPEQLKNYLELATSLGLSAIVEAHDEQEVQQALTAGARIIGVNNRNLKDFTVDLQTSLRLRRLVPSQIAFISESGVKTAADVDRLRQDGINGVLIGETMMRATNKVQMLAQLKGQVLA